MWRGVYPFDLAQVIFNIGHHNGGANSHLYCNNGCKKSPYIVVVKIKTVSNDQANNKTDDRRVPESFDLDFER